MKNQLQDLSKMCCDASCIQYHLLKTVDTGSQVNILLCNIISDLIGQRKETQRIIHFCH